MQWRKLQTAIAAGAVAVYAGWMTVIGIGQIADHSDAKEETSERQAEAHFWRAVAGDIPTTSASVENTFADDLKAIVDDPAAIREFRGESNRYGGITEEIGYDPFDETGLNCFECGPLDSYTKARLALIRNGDLTKITDELTLKLDTSGLDLTPFDLSVPLTTLVGYILIGHASYLAAAKFGSVSSMDQHPDEPFEPNSRMLATAPALYLWERHRDRSFEKDVAEDLRGKYPDEMSVLDTVNREIRGMHKSPEKDELRKMHGQVYRELARQSRRSETSRDEERRTAMVDRLRDLSSVVEARDEALDDLDQLDKGGR